MRNKYYYAGIVANGKRYHLGSFPFTSEGFEAAKSARLLAESRYWYPAGAIHKIISRVPDSRAAQK